MKRMSKAEIIKNYSRFVWQSPEQLHYQARLAFLDGRKAWSSELHRRADVLAKHKRELRSERIRKNVLIGMGCSQ